MKSIDLHIHSTYSDGTLSVEEIIKTAKRKSLQTFMHLVELDLPLMMIWLEFSQRKKKLFLCIKEQLELTGSLQIMLFLLLNLV